MKKILGRVLLALVVTFGLVLGTGFIAAAAAPLYFPSEVTVSTGDLVLVIPVAPLAVTTILGFLAPYVVAVLNAVLPFVTKDWQRKVLSVVVSILLGVAGLVAYYLLTSDPLPATCAEWVGFAFLAIVVCQASYNLVTKSLGARAAEKAITAKLAA